MKIALCSLALGTSFLLSAHADLTIVYSSTVQPAAQATKGKTRLPRAMSRLKLKATKPDRRFTKLSTIVDGTTGEVVNLMNEQKTVVRISRDKVKAVTEMLNKFAGNNKKEKEALKNPTEPNRTKGNDKRTKQKNTLTTGRISKHLLDRAELSRWPWPSSQLQIDNSDFWEPAIHKMPDFRDFPGHDIQCAARRPV